MTMARAVLNAAHGALVFRRRIRILAQHFAQCLPHGAHVLDVGAGDGSLAAAIMALRPDLRIDGIDVLIRPRTQIRIEAFDGQTIPHPDRTFDAVLLIDVLHHTTSPPGLLREAVRVAKNCVVIKDHVRSGRWSVAVLRFMDWVGNRGHGVSLPYNYLSESDWKALFARANVTVEERLVHLALYPIPLTWLFDRRLHFIARLARA